MDEIDRILSSEAHLEPSLELARRVMDEVRRTADAPPPLAFPWRRAAAAAAVIACSCAALAAMPGVLDVLPHLDWSLAIGSLGVLALSFGLASWTLLAAWRAD